MSDRAVLTEALAHTYLDYCQTALAHPSAAALDSIRRAYNRTARIAARMPRSEPARKKIGWPEWEARRAAVSQQLASRIFCEGEPKCLRRLMPEADERTTGKTRASRRGEIEQHIPRLKIGKKAFRSWATEAYNEVCKKVTTRPEQAEKQRKTEGNKKSRIPEDTEKLQRASYYAYLEQKYQGRKETLEDDGRVVIWTDGSAVMRKDEWAAGAGIFYGDGNQANTSFRVEGLATNQRAELAAVLHCLRTEQRPVHIRTDSKYVQLGIELWRHQWRAKGWYQKALKNQEIDHADLWQQECVNCWNEHVPQAPRGDAASPPRLLRAACGARAPVGGHGCRPGKGPVYPLDEQKGSRDIRG
eukprot:gene19406-biopygen43710